MAYQGNPVAITLPITTEMIQDGTIVEADLAAAVVSKLNDSSGKQDTLVSGTNIKTINSVSLLGSGDVEVVTLTSNQTLTNKTLIAPISTGIIDDIGSVQTGITPVAALDIDCSLGNYFTKTINSNSTFTVSNVPQSRAFAFTIEITHTSGAITWFSGVQWPNQTAPTLTTNRTHLFTFITDDGGSRWRGVANTNYTT